MTETDTISLREYIDLKYQHIESLIDNKILSLDRAVTVAKLENDRRLDAMNEFRAALTDQSKSFITRFEHDTLITKYDEQIQTLSEKFDQQIKSLTESRAFLTGKASMSSVYLAYIIAGIGLVLGILGIASDVVLYYLGK